MAETSIGWTMGDDGTAGAVLNPTTGCDRASRGCDNCYAMKMAKRLKLMGAAKYQTDGDPRTSGPGFGVAMHESVIAQPLSWRRPRRIFLNSMSDLFHPKVTDEFIAKVFGMMALAGRHTFQVLTKRAPRMASLLNRPDFRNAVAEHASDLIGSRAWQRWQLDLDDRWTAEQAGPVQQVGVFTSRATLWTPPWPLRNVWLGVSVEDQEQADARLPYLRRTPTVVPWLSCEPLLGPLDLAPLAGVAWVVIGGESGANARPAELGWFRSIRDQCVTAGVPLFTKQAGSVLAREWGCSDRKGEHLADWPEPFPREYPATLVAVHA